MSKMNRLANATNPYQGNEKRVLTVCSAGILRSPTAAVVLAGEPYGYNTRAAGVTDEYALIVVDDVLLHWAHEVVCMEQVHMDNLLGKFPGLPASLFVVLDIPDDYRRMDSDLIALIKQRYDLHLNS